MAAPFESCATAVVAALLLHSGIVRNMSSCAISSLATGDIATAIAALVCAAASAYSVQRSLPSATPAVRLERSSSRGSEGGPSPALINVPRCPPTRTPDAYSAASWSAFATLSFLDDLFVRGDAAQLDMPDVDDMPPGVNTAVWMDALWAQVVASSGEANSSAGWLLRTLFTLFGPRWCVLGAVQALSVALSFAGPLLLNALLSYLDADSGATAASPWYGMLWACMLVAAAVVGAFVSTHFNVAALAMQLQLRAGIIGAAYRSMLACPPASFAGFSAGRVNNLVSVDVQKLMDAVTSIHQFWSLPVQVAITLWLMYTQVQWSFVAGLCILALFTPVNVLISRRIGALTGDMMTHRDERVRRTGELLAGIRTIKLHAWEVPLVQRLHVVRGLEVRALTSRKYLDAVCVLLWASTPPLISLATFATVVLSSRSDGHVLTTASVFTTVSLLNMLIFPMNAFPWVLTGVLEAFVSLRRLENFFAARAIAGDDTDEAALLARSGVKRAVLASVAGAWKFCEAATVDGNEESAPPQSRFVLHTTPARSAVLNPMHIEQGQLVVIAGPVGAGKSALLHALLGNLAPHVALQPALQGSPRSPSYMHIPSLRHVGCTVSYAPQAPWIVAASIRENIVHAAVWDADRYARVLTACALHDDLRSFADSDETLVSSSTLSGGQAQRIALARALYADGELLLADDVTSALDARVSCAVWAACIGRRRAVARSTSNGVASGALNGASRAAVLSKWHAFDAGEKSFLHSEQRTCVVVTHDARFWRDADRLVYMSQGDILFDGPPAAMPAAMWPAAHAALPEPEAVTAATSVAVPTPASSPSVIKDKDIYSIADSTADTAVDDQAPSAAADRVEARARGAVKMTVMSRYVVSAGQMLALLVLLSLTFMQLTRNGTDWWLSVWSAVDATSSGAAGGSSGFSNPNAGLEALLTQWTDRQLLLVLGCIVAANFVVTCVRAVSFARACLVACQDVHDTLLAAVMAAPMRFHDVTSAGTLLNRFSADQYSTDETLPFQLNILLAQTWGIAGTLLVLGFATSGIFLLVTPVIGMAYYRLQAHYRNTSRELKRLDSVTRSPLYNHISDSLRGRDVIRAAALHRTTINIQQQRSSGTVDYEWARNTQLVDGNQRTSWVSGLASSWLGLRLQLIGACVQALVAFAAVLMRVYLDTSQAAPGDDAGCTATPAAPAVLRDSSVATNVAGLAGLALSYAIPIVGSLQGFLGAFTETEKELVAVERAMEFMDVPPEAGTNNSDAIAAQPAKVSHDTQEAGLVSPLLSLNADDGSAGASADWKLRSGTVFISALTLRYPGSASPALDGVTLHVRAGEKVGICGRTGSGKSSLIAALWRLAPWQSGSILLDGVDSRSIPLHALRSQLSAIPQEPLLFSGSVRFNLDPLDMYSDEKVQAALTACFAERHGAGRPAITLMDVVEEGGKNLSHGERQLLCLARAMLKQSRIVCVDEPTANTDADTDAALTAVMEKAFAGATLLIVAHRVRTLMRCDRIIVMSKGRIVESGPPAVLAAQAGSEFAALVAAAGSASSIT